VDVFLKHGVYSDSASVHKLLLCKFDEQTDSETVSW